MEELTPEIGEQIPPSTVVESPPGRNNFKVRLILAVFAVIVLAVLAVAATGLRKKGEAPVKTDQVAQAVTLIPSEEIIGTLPDGYKSIEYFARYNPDTHTYAYSLDKYKNTASSSATIVVNGVSGKTYDAIDNLTISPDGKQVAFVATKNNKQFVVVDGKEGKYYDAAGAIVFSPDSSSLAYFAGEGRYLKEGIGYLTRTSFIVIDGKEGKRYDGMGETPVSASVNWPVFSKDGSKIAYSTIKNKKQIIVVDGIEYADYESQFSPRFVGNTYDIVYTASEKDKYFVVVSGKPQPSFEYISGPFLFDVDNNKTKLVYTTHDGPQKYTLVIDDVVYQLPEEFIWSLTFSKSGNNFAYFIGIAEGVECRPDCVRPRLYLNGKDYVPVYTSGTTRTSSLTFSPDEKMLAYAEETTQTLRSYQDVKLYVYSVSPLKKLGEISLPFYSNVGGVKFSDDSKKLSFKVIKDRKMLLDTVDLSQLKP